MHPCILLFFQLFYLKEKQKNKNKLVRSVRIYLKHYQVLPKKSNISDIRNYYLTNKKLKILKFGLTKLLSSCLLTYIVERPSLNS